MSTTDPILVEAYKFIRGGQFKAARQNLRQAIKNNPYSQRAWLLMSMAVTDAAQQQECLRRVLSLNPNNTEAQQRLAQLQSVETIAPEPPQAESLEASASEPQLEIEAQPTVVEEVVETIEESPTEAIAPQTELEPEIETEVVAAPVESGGVEVEPVLEAVAEPAAEVAPTVEEASAVEPPTETTSAEAWSSEPQGLPEWLVAQSLIDETLPDVEPVTEQEEYEEDDDELESEAEVVEAIRVESDPRVETVTAGTAEITPPANREEATGEPTPAPRAKRRRARRLHTDYLRAHQTQAEDDLPAWLKEEAEMSTHPPVAAKPMVVPVETSPSAPVAPAVAPPIALTPVAPPPAARLEPAPIRVQPPRMPAAPAEKEPVRPYYSNNYVQGDVPSWALPVLLILLTLVVMGLVALMIYMVL